MFLDTQIRFSNAQAITVTATSTSHVDLGMLAGAGYPLKIRAHVDGTSFVGTGSSLGVEFLTRPGTTGVWRAHWKLAGYATASLTAGSVLELPNVPKTNDRYAVLRYVVRSTFTAGRVSSYILLDDQTNKYDFGRADVAKLVP